MDNGSQEERSVRVLGRKLIIGGKEPGLQWLIGSPFLPPLTIVSTMRCLHTLPGDTFSPDYTKESVDLRTLLLRGFDIIGALLPGDSNLDQNAGKAADAARRMRKFLSGEDRGIRDTVGGVADLTTGDIRFFVSEPENPQNLGAVTTVVYEENPDKYMSERVCLLRCELAMSFPIYVPTNTASDAEKVWSSATEAVAAKFRDPEVVFILEAVNESSEGVSRPLMIRGMELDYKTHLSDILSKGVAKEFDVKAVSCSSFCSNSKPALSSTSGENAGTIQVSILLNKSESTPKAVAPLAEYFPASEPARLLVVSFKLDVLCYASKDLPVVHAVSKLIVPGLVDQFTTTKETLYPNLFTRHPQLRPYHFCPPGVVHPVTVMYELSYGEAEMKQVDIRRSLHLRLGLPLDRPLLLIGNAIKFSISKDHAGSLSTRKGSALLKDVHTEIPSSGVSRGIVSLVQGSYEYYHYLQDGFDDSGWGCAYRSLQTIVSWFKLQHYISIEVPLHREIQHALVEIGDKEPSFVGSREWIGAIELSFVLDKLLGVSCKVMNVRSGSELPEKCRELALHFETQGTPVMIGGGVLAYTLLGVDYNVTSGDCAFLILDPHYMGNDELKKIVNGGWCGWKKAVDSKVQRCCCLWDLFCTDLHFLGNGFKRGAPTFGFGVRHIRRSHSAKLARVKKDGAGGKGTWGKLLDTDGGPFVDRNDPNYDSGEEPYQLVGATISDPLDEYKKAVVAIIEEYFSTGDVELAASDLRELGSSEYHPYFVKRLISMAMDRHDKEKEMASVLLSALYADVISSAEISQGFLLLLETADDLALDILDAVDILALFIARAVVDDILPPVFITRAKKTLPESLKGHQVLQTAEKSYLSAPHHAELVERRWGGSTHITVEEVKKKISDLLREYVESGDTVEACRCIRELGVSFFHHEVVKRALTLAMEIQTAEPLIFNLLKEAAEEGLISSSQMTKGFGRLAESLDDLSLDIPSAKTLFQSLVPNAISEGWLDASFLKTSADNGELGGNDSEKVRRFKEEAVTIIHEYFLSDDIPELIRSLEDLAAPEFNPVFLKKLITLAMDRKNREKEMSSVLLSALHSEIFSTEDIVNGFVMLLESAEDTALDILDASNELAYFLARAVVDDVLAPLNLDEISSKLPPNCSGSETVHMARSLLAARHAGERILRCWGGGTGWAVEDAKDKITKLLEEYESGGVVAEARQCIRDLGMPFFNHEVVKKALVMAMEKKNDRMLDLLQECFGEGLITINQMTKGFARIRDGLDDLALDIPNAEEKFKFYVEHAMNNRWLLPSFEPDDALPSPDDTA
ncbi:hypothetical protein NE237_021455 [Protea cynaroides]|uniref:Uncharacterized protein n=1 Tax=Protea cynaroides TaxID=273540 RepID=A0A9Q0H957_9MAGN|nr:hypothetical protein NE237_021455 [Protea cynaroides]